MLKTKYTAQFKRDYRRALRRGCDPRKLERVIRCLAAEEPLPRQHRDGPLQDDHGYREMRCCEIEPGWELIYQVDRDRLLLKLIRAYAAVNKNALGMSADLSLRQLLRSPAKTALIFLLIAAVTFGLVSQVGEYVISRREVEVAAQEYKGVGSAEASQSMVEGNETTYLYTDPRLTMDGVDREIVLEIQERVYTHLTSEQIERLSTMDYVTNIDARCMTAGVSDTLLRLDDGTSFANFTSRAIIEATFGFSTFNEEESSVQETGMIANNIATLLDCKIIYGSIPAAWELEGNNASISYYYDGNRWGKPVGLGATGVRRDLDLTLTGTVYNSEMFKKMEPEKRYLFVLLFDPYSQYIRTFYPGGDQCSAYCEMIYPLEDEPANYLETEKFSGVRQMIEVNERDRHTFDVVYTDNMTSIRRFAERDMVITEGRMLTEKDGASCVISQQLSETYNLHVGDKFSLRLGTALFEQFKSLGAQAVLPERFFPVEKEVVLSVVGIYTDTDGNELQQREPNWSYSVNTVFVPKSMLPENVDLTEHTYAPGEFSFVIENAWDISAFVEQAEPLIEDLGLTMIFSDGGWQEIVRQYESTKSVAIVRISLFGTAMITAIWFACVLFITGKRKDYAIMRALGTQRRQVGLALLVPLSVLTVLSIIIGSVFGCIFTQQSTAYTGVIAGVAAACAGGEIVVTLALAVLILHRFDRQSVLLLLQDRHVRPARKKKQHKAHGEMISTPVLTDTVLPKSVARMKDRPLRFMTSYVFRHICRSHIKTALSILLAAFVFCAVGQLRLMGDNYVMLLQNTKIEARFVGGLPLGKIADLENSGLTEEIFYYGTSTFDLNMETVDAVVTNDPERFAEETPVYSFLDGMDETVFQSRKSVLVLGDQLMERLGIALGDKVVLTTKGYMQDKIRNIILEYRSGHPETDLSDEQIVQLEQESLARDYKTIGMEFTVVGSIHLSSGKYADTVFMPGMKVSNSAVYGESVVLSSVIATVSDNDRIREMRELGEDLCRLVTRNDIKMVMDTAKLESLEKTVVLFKTLYPAAVIVSLVIGGFLAALAIVQSAKEAAILRILGTTRRRTRAMLSSEQIVLAAAGLLLGAGALLIWRGAQLLGISRQLALFGGLYLITVAAAAIVCAVFVTRRSVLELLQTKE